MTAKSLKLIIRHRCSGGDCPPGIIPQDIETELTELTDESTEEILPEHAEHYVYHNINYEFYISGADSVPTKLRINDENFPFVVSHKEDHLMLSLNGQNTDINQKPFLYSFGSVRIELVIDNKIYATENIYIRIARHTNQNIIRMIEYIDQNSRQFLYEERKYSRIQKDIGKHQTIPIELKLKQCEEIWEVYEKCYGILRKNPYSRLIQVEKTDHFGRLQSVSPRTMQYIAQHVDELEPVAYYTGITIHQQNYQPRRTCMTTTQETREVYENQILLDFLYTILQNLFRMETDLQQRLGLLQELKEQGDYGDYIDSRVYIYQHSIRVLRDYLKEVQELIQKFRKLLYHYTHLFPMPARELRYQPKCSPVFRSNMPYRLIYEKISIWFAYGDYHLRQHDLLLSFISISRIYEYYCLVKFLEYFSRHPEFEKKEFSRFLYPETKFYKNTKYNNTFVFRWQGHTLTLYFQPVIYGNSGCRYNQIHLYRNTSSTVAGGRTGRTYTPDFMLKLKSDAGEHYFMMDAKYSTLQVIRQYQLTDLVYKYLFSISPLEEDASVDGLYLLCGKHENKADHSENLHDIASSFRPKKRVRPFAELMTMTAYHINDDSMMDLVLETLREEKNRDQDEDPGKK